LWLVLWVVAVGKATYLESLRPAPLSAKIRSQTSKR
jgi:hypothetical protein